MRLLRRICGGWEGGGREEGRGLHSARSQRFQCPLEGLAKSFQAIQRWDAAGRRVLGYLPARRKEKKGVKTKHSGCPGLRVHGV